MRMPIACVFLLLSGCSTTPAPVTSNPAQSQVDDIRHETYSVLRENVNKSTPPIDLSEYKNIQFNIKQEKGVPLVQMQYSDFSRMMEMLHQLGTRIEVQRAYLGTTLDLLDKKMTPAGGSSP